MFKPMKTQNSDKVTVYLNMLYRSVRCFFLPLKLECNNNSLAELSFYHRKIDAPEPTRTLIHTVSKFDGVTYVGFPANNSRNLYVMVENVEDWDRITEQILEYLENYISLMEKKEQSEQNS